MGQSDAIISDQNKETDQHPDAKPKDASACLFDSVSDNICGKGKHSDGDGKSANPLEIKDHGQIKTMSVPEGWSIKSSEHVDIGTRSYQEVSPKGAPDTSLSFFYRGLPVGDEDAANFKSVLSKEPHVLTPAELDSLSAVLSIKTPVNSPDFQMTSARSEEVNGKKVLVVDGTYPATGKDSAQKIHEMYVNADGHGRDVQEIFYQAPADSYDKYLTQAQAALQSIKWK